MAEHEKKVIVEVDSAFGLIRVIKTDEGQYNVVCGGEVKHPNCDSEGALRALGHYIASLSHKLSRQ